MWMHIYLKMDSLIKCFIFSNVFLFLGHWWRTGGDWDECWSKENDISPKLIQQWVLKEDAALDVVKDVKVTWHTAKNGDLYSEFVLCIYPILSAHTHREHTPGAVGSHLCCGARGAVGGSVPCSRAPQSWYWGWRECCTFTPPFFMTISIMLKRSWKLTVMHDLYSWTMKQTVSV